MHLRRQWKGWGAAAVALLASAALLPLGAQGRVRVEPNVPYDGEFTFVRLRYTNFGPSGWAFDYPAMERNFSTILHALTTVHPHRQGSNIHTMDDPELFNYTVAYLSEPGYWLPSDREAAGLRIWLNRGGFLIVDDFLFDQWANFEQAMRKVLPMARFVRLDRSHPIFDAFFRIPTLDGLYHPGTPEATAQYYGIYENNDPTQRLQVMWAV